MFYYSLNEYLDFILRIVIACICGYLIGSERENRRKFAGVRTHTIVALGASLAMIISKYGFYDSDNFDAARIAAQIISGIGFLGAGVIFVKNNGVTGLTTAAGIWTTSIIGMAFGSGMYIIGLISTFLILILQLFVYNHELFTIENGKIYNVSIKSKYSEIIDQIEEYIEKNEIEKKTYRMKYVDHKFNLSFQYIAKSIEERNDFIAYLENSLHVDNFKFL